MFGTVERTILDEMERSRLPGVAVCVIKGSETVWSAGFGLANIETAGTMTPDTVCSIQSVTKPILATALMHLCDRGGFSLDDPVEKHIGPVIRNEFEDGAPVTIRHLLTHTSGLPVDTAAGFPATEGKRSLREHLSTVAKTVRAPGEDMEYANWGYDTLGILIEALTASRWDQYVRDHIFSRLGMASSSVSAPLPGTVPATGYFLSEVDNELHPLSPYIDFTDPPSPAGSILSTTSDLSRFLASHIDAGRVLSMNAVSEMHRLQATDGSGTSGMGLGFRVTRSNGHKLVCHGGDGLGFTNFIGIHPEIQMGVVLLINRGGAQASRSVIANAALRCLTGESNQASRLPGSPAVNVSGLYKSNFWEIEALVSSEGERLVVEPVAGLVLSDKGRKSYLEPLEGTRFLAQAGMFDGFEVTLETGDASTRLFGGVYPWRFERVGGLPQPEPPIDSAADLTGTWVGTAETPMGPLRVEISVAGPRDATVSTPFAPNLPLIDCVAEAGAIAGHFSMTVPGIGEMEMFPRLSVRAGRLRGHVYAQGWFGETAMKTDLQRA